MISALEGLMIVWGGARKSDMHDLFGVEKDEHTNASPIIVSKWLLSCGNPKDLVISSN